MSQNTEDHVMPFILHTSPARETSGNINWVLSDPPQTLNIGTNIYILNPRNQEHSLCELAEIHGCWGRYAIISLVTMDSNWEEEGEEILCWITSKSLILSDRLARKSHQGIRHLTFCPLA